MSFLDDVDEEREGNWPVRREVKANAAKIKLGRDAGRSLNAIYRTLTRQGESVGKGYSSFRTAVLYLDQHGWPTAPASSEPSPAVNSDVEQGSRDRFIDTRNSSDF